MKTIAFVLAAFALAFSQAANEWPIIHNTNHTSFSPTTVLKPPLKVKWMTKIQGFSQNPGPVVAEGKVVIQDEGGYLFCLDAETGELLWRDFIPAEGASSIAAYTSGVGNTSACICNGKVYAAFFVKGSLSQNGMRCYDLITGNLLWRKDAGCVSGRIKFSPQVSKGRLFYISNVDVNHAASPGPYNYKPQVQAWDAVTGDSLWTYTLWDSACNNTTLLVVGDTVFASVGLAYGSIEGRTVALDLNGNVLWQSTQYHVWGYLGNMQYLPGQLWMLSCGEGCWSVATTVINTSDWSLRFVGPGEGYSKVYAMMNGRYWSSGFAQLPQAYNIQTGAFILGCHFFPGDAFWSGCSTPVAANGYIYKGFGNPTAPCLNPKMVAFDENGGPVWSFPTGGTCCPSAAIAYDHLFEVTGGDGLVYCFESKE